MYAKHFGNKLNLHQFLHLALKCDLDLGWFVEQCFSTFNSNLDLQLFWTNVRNEMAQLLMVENSYAKLYWNPLVTDINCAADRASRNLVWMVTGQTDNTK